VSRWVAAWFLLAGLALLPARSEGAADEALPAGALARLGTARFQNIGRVFAVAYAPDGKTLAAGAWDGSIRLWDPATGKQLRQWTGHDGWVRAVAFSPDGKKLASGGKDQVIRLWHTATGKLLRRLPPCRSRVTDLAFSQDGRTVFSTLEGGVRLWDVAAGRPRRGLSGLGEMVAAAPAPDGRTLATATATATGQSISLWDIASGNQRRRLLDLPRGWVRSLAFSPDGQTLAAGFFFQRQGIRLWDIPSGKERLAPSRPGRDNAVLAFSPDGRLLASGDSAGGIRIWEVATGGLRYRLRGPDRGEVPLAFSRDGRVLAAGSVDVTVLLWDITGRVRGGKLAAADLMPAELNSLWADLQSADAARAHRAVWALVSSPDKSLPFLKEHFRPRAAADPRRTAALLADLDSPHYAVRVRAAAGLAKLGAEARPALLEALRGRPSVELRRRVELLLRKLDASPETLRTVRAVEVLERIGTPEARRLLRALAGGAPSAHRTREAQAALKRLADS
jgi:Tol biopolymer transport system component